MIKCIYCDSFLVSLSGHMRGDEKFCTNCNCSFFLKENKLIMTSFSFYLNEYYFGIDLNHKDNKTSINGAYYPNNEYMKFTLKSAVATKNFEKTFDRIINHSPKCKK